ncbi:hypothetical protein [Shouchella shacheensis]|uniref:hypothetical protein n=1 Tax=Shouchella shacheensis TaxID=1649580 RepID=UPI0007404A32|nr:hypothetical protein [Shouchella shacheensis]
MIFLSIFLLVVFIDGMLIYFFANEKPMYIAAFGALCAVLAPVTWLVVSMLSLHEGLTYGWFVTSVVLLLNGVILLLLVGWNVARKKG